MPEMTMPDLRDINHNLNEGMMDLRERIQSSAHHLEKLGQSHLQAIRLYVQGFSERKIETMLGFTMGWFSTFIVCDLAQAKLKELTDQLDKGVIDSVNLSQKIFQDSAPAIARNLVNLAFDSEKDADKINASVNAIKFARDGITEEQARSTSIKIVVGDKEVDIFDNIKQVQVDGDAVEVDDAESASQEVEEGSEGEKAQEPG
jgi:hypothetical protein